MTRYSWLLIVLIFATPAVAGKSLTLSDADERRLQAGELIVLDVLPPGRIVTGTQGGTALALIHASPQTVWRVLVDYRRHSGLYPRVVGADVVESDSTRALVRYVVGVGPLSFAFYVNNYSDEARGRLHWRLAHDRPNELFRDSWGYWQLEPTADGVLVIYAMAARMTLPPFLTRGADRDALVETLKAVRDRAEGRGTAGTPGPPRQEPVGTTATSSAGCPKVGGQGPGHPLDSPRLASGCASHCGRRNRLLGESSEGAGGVRGPFLGPRIKAAPSDCLRDDHVLRGDDEWNPGRIDEVGFIGAHPRVLGRGG